MIANMILGAGIYSFVLSLAFYSDLRLSKILAAASLLCWFIYVVAKCAKKARPAKRTGRTYSKGVERSNTINIIHNAAQKVKVRK